MQLSQPLPTTSTPIKQKKKPSQIAGPPSTAIVTAHDESKPSDIETEICAATKDNKRMKPLVALLARSRCLSDSQKRLLTTAWITPLVDLLILSAWLKKVQSALHILVGLLHVVAITCQAISHIADEDWSWLPIPGVVATTATALAAVVHGITQIVNTFNKSPAQLESAFENGSQVGKRFLAKLEGAGKPCSEVQLYAFIAHDLGAALGGLGTAVLSDVSDMAPQVAEIRMNAVNAQRELAL